MHTKNHKTIIITPVYEDIEACSKVLKELKKLFNKDAYIVAVDDGSINQPLTISIFKNIGIDGCIIKLKRNLGHQRALAIGICFISNQLDSNHIVVLMDSDGEDNPNSIPKLISELYKKDIDVVVSSRKRRTESIFFRMFYFFYKIFFRILTGRAISFGNFMILKPIAIKQIVTMQELSTHIAGTILSSNLRVGNCPIDRGRRYEGKSKLNFLALVLHGFRGLMVFAENVLIRVGITCTAIAIFSVLGAITAILLKIIGFSTPGWFSIALGVLVIIFLQTAALALILLMLTGIMRNSTFTALFSYQEFIDQVFETKYSKIKNE